MAIDLLNSFLQRGQNVSSNSKNNTSKTITQTTQNIPKNLQVVRAIRALQAGQTIQLSTGTAGQSSHIGAAGICYHLGSNGGVFYGDHLHARHRWHRRGLLHQGGP